MASRFDLFSWAFQKAYGSAYRRFHAHLAVPEEAQARLLSELVHGVSGTDYGRHHGVGPGDSYDQFARKLPVVDYEELSPWIVRQQASLHKVLCPADVVFYERTSGSSGPSKAIPYTRDLQRSFVRMFLLWACDSFAHGPKLSSGATFMSVSPDLAGHDDSDYLPRLLRYLIGGFLVLPRGLRQITDAATFKRILAVYLLDEAALEVISIWNPSYFSSLLAFIEDNRRAIAGDLLEGRLSAEGRTFILRKSTAARRRYCAALLEQGKPDFTVLWPQLKLLSCWTDGNAALVLHGLVERLPHATVQAKGLVATEAPITIPLWQANGPVPLLTEVFCEFSGEDGRIHRLHELDVGARYDLIISQRAGLTRYRIGDRVEVTGRFLATPTLRFIGRTREVSDLVGEKLNESFVREALSGETLLTHVRWMLLPTILEEGPCYVCLLDGPHRSGDIARSIDERLQNAHHYRLARQMGQLGPIVVQRHEGLDESYLAWSSQSGRKWGNIKPSVLLSDVPRARAFLQWINS